MLLQALHMWSKIFESEIYNFLLWKHVKCPIKDKLDKAELWKQKATANSVLFWQQSSYWHVKWYNWQ